MCIGKVSEDSIPFSNVAAQGALAAVQAIGSAVNLGEIEQTVDCGGAKSFGATFPAIFPSTFQA